MLRSESFVTTIDTPLHVARERRMTASVSHAMQPTTYGVSDINRPNVSEIWSKTAVMFEAVANENWRLSSNDSLASRSFKLTADGCDLLLGTTIAGSGGVNIKPPFDSGLSDTMIGAEDADSSPAGESFLRVVTVFDFILSSTRSIVC